MWKFWLRFILYIFLTYCVPIILILHYYSFWKDGGFTIAGILIIVIVSLGLIKIGSLFKEALWYRYWVQCILALSTSIWIIAIYFVADIISVNVDVVKKVALISFFSVILGKLISPLPAWVDKMKENKQIDTIRKAMK